MSNVNIVGCRHENMYITQVFFYSPAAVPWHACPWGYFRKEYEKSHRQTNSVLNWETNETSEVLVQRNSCVDPKACKRLISSQLELSLVGTP